MEALLLSWVRAPQVEELVL